MARAYSDDLRRKVLEAWLGGGVTMRALAVRFSVSYGWVRKICAVHRATGSMVRAPQRSRGRRSRIDAELVRSLVRQKPDIVLRELQAELAKAGVGVSIAHIARVLKGLGFRLKKSRSTPANGTPKRTGSSAKHSSRGSGRLRRKT